MRFESLKAIKKFCFVCLSQFIELFTVGQNAAWKSKAV